jgi:hypothetical protein
MAVPRAMYLPPAEKSDISNPHSMNPHWDGDLMSPLGRTYPKTINKMDPKDPKRPARPLAPRDGHSAANLE